MQFRMSFETQEFTEHCCIRVYAINMCHTYIVVVGVVVSFGIGNVHAVHISHVRTFAHDVLSKLSGMVLFRFDGWLFCLCVHQFVPFLFRLESARVTDK